MLEFKYDTQLLIEGEDLDEDVISEYFTEHFKGDCLLAVGDEELIKVHFHTNEPWQLLEYCASLGEIYDIVVEDMDRQARGLKAMAVAEEGESSAAAFCGPVGPGGSGPARILGGNFRGESQESHDIWKK